MTHRSGVSSGSGCCPPRRRTSWGKLRRDGRPPDAAIWADALRRIPYARHASPASRLVGAIAPDAPCRRRWGPPRHAGSARLRSSRNGAGPADADGDARRDRGDRARAGHLAARAQRPRHQRSRPAVLRAPRVSPGHGRLPTGDALRRTSQPMMSFNGADARRLRRAGSAAMSAAEGRCRSSCPPPIPASRRPLSRSCPQKREDSPDVDADRRRDHRRRARPRRRRAGRDLTARWDRVTLTPETLAYTPDARSTRRSMRPVPDDRAGTGAGGIPHPCLPRAPGAPRRDVDRRRRRRRSAGAGRRSSAAGLYVPGGTAAYPSSVLMNAMPAKVAGVTSARRCTCPTPDGVVNPLVLLACRTSPGWTRCSGSAARRRSPRWPTGRRACAPVDKITGPGNA